MASSHGSWTDAIACEWHSNQHEQFGDLRKTYDEKSLTPLDWQYGRNARATGRLTVKSGYTFVCPRCDSLLRKGVLSHVECRTQF